MVVSTNHHPSSANILIPIVDRDLNELRYLCLGRISDIGWESDSIKKQMTMEDITETHGP